MNEINVWHVANSGVILKVGQFNIGIDILCEQIVPFMKTPEALEDQLPLLDYLIITHEHRDHYSKHKIVKFLNLQPNVKVISNETVISELHGIFDENRLIAVSAGRKGDIEIEDGEVGIRIFHSTHMGTEYKDTINLSIIIRWLGKKILIPGDADPRELLHSERLNSQTFDFLIVPFPYITLISVRKSVTEKIKPKQMLIIHLPAKEHDKGNWIARSKEIYQKEAGSFPKVEFGERLGERYLFQ